MKKDILTRPFLAEQVKQRQGQGGKTLSYVPTFAVVQRLNEACDAWSFEVVEHQILDDEIIVVAKLTADGVVKTAFGGSAITRDRDGKPVSLADDAKSAASDALKKAASLLGVGLELYGAPPEVQPTRPTARVAEPVDRLTGKQYSAIQSVARRKNLSQATFGEMLGERFRKSDLGQLTRREASAFLSELTEANGHGPHA